MLFRSVFSITLPVTFTPVLTTAPTTDTAAPAAADTASLKFANASCQRWDVGHYAAWRHLANEELDLVMFLGDYIYEYASPPGALRQTEGGLGFVSTLPQYRARYATHKSDPALQAAHAAAPWLVVWDDHEVANDYATLQGQMLQPTFTRKPGTRRRAVP